MRMARTSTRVIPLPLCTENLLFITVIRIAEIMIKLLLLFIFAETRKTKNYEKKRKNVSVARFYGVAVSY